MPSHAGGTQRTRPCHRDAEPLRTEHPAPARVRVHGCGHGRKDKDKGQSPVHRGFTHFPLPVWPDLSSPGGPRGPAAMAPAPFPAPAQERESRIWSAGTAGESSREGLHCHSHPRAVPCLQLVSPGLSAAAHLPARGIFGVTHPKSSSSSVSLPASAGSVPTTGFLVVNDLGDVAFPQLPAGNNSQPPSASQQADCLTSFQNFLAEFHFFLTSLRALCHLKHDKILCSLL